MEPRVETVRLQAALGIESFFTEFKQWQRITTRYDKLAANFLGFIKPAASCSGSNS
jgi:transposase